jgi:hypothetical protein
MSNQTFGHLSVVSFYGKGDGRLLWWCLCKCGKQRTVRGEDLRSGNTKSCGCNQRAAAIAACTTHGACVGGKTKEYRAYIQAKVRCTNEKASGEKWKHYGGRGIQFRFTSFPEFYAEIGPAPSPQHSVDRIENNGHYAIGNIRWADKITQSQNRRTSWRHRA